MLRSFRSSLLPSSCPSVRLHHRCLSFASCDPRSISGNSPHNIYNSVNGKWTTTRDTYDVIDPLNGEKFIKTPLTQSDEIHPFVESLRTTSKTGLHNPLKNVERYRLYGEVFAKAAAQLHQKDNLDFFTECIRRVMPKSDPQARGEVIMMRSFFENFSGDSARFTCRGFTVAGDRAGAQTMGYRFPYGPVVVIAPFNFPMEIVAMQTMSAVMVGNKPLVKADDRTGLPMEQFLRFMHACGMPSNDVDLISCRGPVMSEVVAAAKPKMLQFTGSTAISNQLAVLTKGRMKTEDSGYDWKILGPDVQDEGYVAWQSDQDAYAMSGQKCSAQSLLMAHENWMKAGFVDRIAALASRRTLKDGTLSPIITHDNKSVKSHIAALTALPGARLLFGGTEVQEPNTVPPQYGTIAPTAIFVPLDTILMKEHYPLCTKELFGPVQIITEWKTGQEAKVIKICEDMEHHLTAGIVSNDLNFCNKMLAETVNGTTYFGIRARTTGAPQNHWFGLAGDPMAAAIHTPEAILHTWTCHREIIQDVGPVPEGWTLPAAT